MTPKISPHHVHRMPTSPPVKRTDNRTGADEPFARLLDREIEKREGLKVTKHARRRLQERNITIDPGQWRAIEARVNEAKHKGVTESLVVTEEAALVVSAKNNAVITAMDRREASTHIFTNINGTILMGEGPDLYGGPDLRTDRSKSIK